MLAEERTEHMSNANPTFIDSDLSSECSTKGTLFGGALFFCPQVPDTDSPRPLRLEATRPGHADSEQRRSATREPANPVNRRSPVVQLQRSKKSDGNGDQTVSLVLPGDMQKDGGMPNGSVCMSKSRHGGSSIRLVQRASGASTPPALRAVSPGKRLKYEGESQQPAAMDMRQHNVGIIGKAAEASAEQGFTASDVLPCSSGLGLREIRG